MLIPDGKQNMLALLLLEQTNKSKSKILEDSETENIPVTGTSNYPSNTLLEILD